jgi:hypothetical protein
MAAIGRRGGEARGANRAARMQNAGSEASSGTAQSGQRFQGDREVGLSANNNQPASANQSGQRQSGNALGGERRPNSSDERNVERP